EIRTKVDKMRKDSEGRVQKILLPNQFDRLKQLDLQSKIQRNGAAALSDGEVADALNLTDAQKEQLREKSEQVQKDLQDKIRQLRTDARNQLLDVLTSEQRTKLQSMMGDQFDLPDNIPAPGVQFARGGAGGRQFGNGGGRGRRGGRGAGENS